MRWCVPLEHGFVLSHLSWCWRRSHLERVEFIGHRVELDFGLGHRHDLGHHRLGHRSRCGRLLLPVGAGWLVGVIVVVGLGFGLVMELLLLSIWLIRVAPTALIIIVVVAILLLLVVVVVVLVSVLVVVALLLLLVRLLLVLLVLGWCLVAAVSLLFLSSSCSTSSRRLVVTKLLGWGRLLLLLERLGCWGEGGRACP